MIRTNSTASLDIIDTLWDPVYALVEGSLALPNPSPEQRNNVDLADVIAPYLEHLLKIVPTSSRKRSIDNDTNPATTPDTSMELLESWADGTLPIPSPIDDSTAIPAPLTIDEVEEFINALRESIIIWRGELQSTGMPTDSELIERSVATVGNDLRKRVDPLTLLALFALIVKLLEK